MFTLNTLDVTIVFFLIQFLVNIAEEQNYFVTVSISVTNN